MGVIKTRQPITRKQSGLVVVLFTLSLLVLMGFAALAIDINHIILNKSRVQNSVDSAALSASIALEKGVTVEKAAEAAVDTIKAMAKSAGNDELDLDVIGLSSNSVATKEYKYQSNDGTLVTVQFSNNPITFPAVNALSTAEDIYTRVSVDGHGLQSFLIQIFGINKSVKASAVSGRSSGVQNSSNLAPIGVCEQGSTNYGYDIGTEYQLAGKTSGNSGGNSSCKNKNKCDEEPNSGDIGSGNYNYLRLDGYGNGADGLGDALGGKAPGEFADGETGVYFIDGTVDTKPGVNNGPVTGFNSRWNQEDGFPAPDTDTTATNYSEYNGNGRRTFVVPVVDCSGNTNGAKPVTIMGFACFFLTQEYDKKDKIIYGEFYTQGCTVPNGGGGLNPTATGPYKIQLYRDLATGAS
ncbi:von willebrand factor type A domain protein [Vibrio ishigakensis]|uniref:von willebrand factor type A domain protein n=1 Tax=Vibrio ishigakensis TaxID=1481914 RepID=A0A0B8QGX7_9VIBR|nr:von willebrand factor type A domain protein [Vibrio ishigakensis]